MHVLVVEVRRFSPFIVRQAFLADESIPQDNLINSRVLTRQLKLQKFLVTVANDGQGLSVAVASPLFQSLTQFGHHQRRLT
jgi:hypothetical protein